MRIYMFVLLAIISKYTYSYEERKSLGPEYKKLKFGVVVENEDFLIYRSKKLGEKGLDRLFSYLNKNGLSFPKTIIYLNKTGYRFPFTFALDEFFLQDEYNYRFFHSFGKQRTYINGHDPYFTKEDIDKKILLSRSVRKYFPLLDNGFDGSEEDVLRVLGLVLDRANQPVLFHCHGGRHRTGMVAMMIRHIQGGWWVQGPITRKNGLNLNPAEYEYYKFNRSMFRRENIRFVRKLSQDQRFLMLKKQYENLLN